MNASETVGAKRRRVSHACDACQRRKERCNGLQPCTRCVERRAVPSCRFSARCRTADRARQHRSDNGNSASAVPRSDHDSITRSRAQKSPESPLEHTRLIRDSKGRCMFIGDSANLSFLQSIRRLVQNCVGSCQFVDDPLRYLMVEPSPDDGQPGWVDANDHAAGLTVSLAQARELIKRYLLATNCVLDLFDASELLLHAESWVNDKLLDDAPPSPVYFLVLAIGAQTSPQGRDAFAAKLFNRGRYLTAQRFMEDASIRTIQLYALMTMYLLGACRRNAAFMYLGTAVRAAYAVGLHRKEIAAVFPQAEFEERERLWKVLRILDLFMSASLGRPPSTNETRDTTASPDYSASNDLCAIFELILTDVYSKRSVSTEVLSNIGAKHRKWAAKFSEGLSADKIAPTEFVGNGTTPNIGLLHVKEAYYWTIILLTRPFLSEAVVLHAEKIKSSDHGIAAFDSNNAVLVNACVDSAIRTVGLLQTLHGYEDLPRRLPFVVNSLFIASLVLGCAYFGDLYQTFPLAQHMQLARELLAQFKHDAIAQRNASIIGYLQDACAVWLEKRNAQRLAMQGRAVGVMFGQIHHRHSQASTRDQTPQGREYDLETSGEVEVHYDHGGSTTRNGPTAEDIVLQSMPNLAHMFSDVEDFTNTPYPVMEPHTIHFDAYGEALPLFLTINDAYGGISTLGAVNGT